jgi:hypothetical protein
MNTNQITHYGKPITELTELERQLLVLDGILTIDFHTKRMGKSNSLLDIGFMNGIGRKRTQLTCTIMGVSFEELEDNDGINEFLEECEKTIYGYKQFLIDLDKNIKIQQRMEEIVSMN